MIIHSPPHSSEKFLRHRQAREQALAIRNDRNYHNDEFLMRTHGTHTNSVEDGEVLGMVQPKKGRTGILRAEKLFRKNLSKSEVKREGWRSRQKSHRRGVGTLES